MRTMRRLMGGFAAMLTLLAGEQAHAGVITIDFPSATWVEIQVDNSSTDSQFNTSTSLPTQATIAVSDQGGSATTDINFAEQAGGTVLTWDFDMARPGMPRFAVSSSATLHFTVNADAVYDLSGAFNMSGSHRIFFEANLFDLTAGSHVFANMQESRSTPGQAFTVGQSDGDWTTNVQGSPTGSLIAGHQYRLFYWAFLDNINDQGAVATDAGASGFGNVRLEMAAAGAPVPEPSTLALLSVATVGVAAARRCKRKTRQ
jgi:hypothetical protein